MSVDLTKKLKRKFGYVACEPHYNYIKPRVIAEEYLQQDDMPFSSSLVDYKVWCFDGKPYCIWTCYNRNTEAAYTNVYDLEWRVHPEHSVFTDHYRDGKGKLPPPRYLNEMLQAAMSLSVGFPEVRVDFYIVDGHLRFGEMTFTSLCGRMNYFNKEFLIEMGNQVKLR